MKRYVLVFDICSSSIILENLVQNEHVQDYTKLIDAFFSYLHMKRKKYKLEVYKFKGDGFMLFFNQDRRIDDVLSFSIELTFFAKQILTWFKKDYLDITKLPREGITIGLSFGSIHKMETVNITTSEYVGRAINLASRLQSRLDRPEHANKLLMQADLYRSIEGHLFKKSCRETTRALRNISGGSEIRCYEFNPEIFIEFDWELLQSPTDKTKRLLSDPDFRDQYISQQKEIERLINDYIAGKPM